MKKYPIILALLMVLLLPLAGHAATCSLTADPISPAYASSGSGSTLPAWNGTFNVYITCPANQAWSLKYVQPSAYVFPQAGGNYMSASICQNSSTCTASDMTEGSIVYNGTGTGSQQTVGTFHYGLTEQITPAACTAGGSSWSCTPGSYTESVNMFTAVVDSTAFSPIISNNLALNFNISLCSYAISPSSVSGESAAGTSSSVTVTTQNRCPWSYSNVLGWASITGSTSINGTDPNNVGSGSVNFSLSPNLTGSTRNGNMTIAAQTFSIGQLALATQTINVSIHAPASAGYNSTFNVAAAATSGLPVAITSSGACSGSGSNGSATITMISSSGTCSVFYNQAGDGVSYGAAAQQTDSVTATPGTQATLTVTGLPSSATYGQSGITAGTTGGTGTGAISYSAGASTACSINSSTGAVTISSASGSCSITATKAADTNYTATTSNAVNITVSKASQTITYTTSAPASAVVGGATYTPAATGGASGNSVTFTIDATASSVCSISGGVVSFNAVGTCVVDANQAGGSNYSAATQVQQSFSVGKGAQTIGTISFSPSSLSVGGTTTVSATGGLSGNAVTFSSLTTSVCIVGGNTVNGVGIGTCTIAADQLGSANYNAATEVTNGITVGKGSQTIYFTTSAPVGATVGSNPYAPAATGGASGTSMVITIDASASSVCSISGGVVSFNAVGTCVVDANDTGNANYNAAPQVQQSFAVGKGTQSALSVTNLPATASYGQNTVTVSTSGGTGSGSITYNATGACSVGSTTGIVSFNIGVGVCSVTATKAADSNYNATTSAAATSTVNKATPTVSTWPTASAITYGQTLASSTLTGGSATPSGGTFTFTTPSTAPGAGTASQSVTYTPTDTTNYSAVTGNVSVTVNLASQSTLILIGLPTNASYLQTGIVAGTSGGSGTGTVTYSATGTACSVGLSTGAVAITSGSGTCSITAIKAADANYSSITSAPVTITVGLASQSINVSTHAPASAALNAQFSVAASSTSGLGVTYGSSGSCVNTGATYTMTSATGTCSVIYSQSGSVNYAPATQVTESVSATTASQATLTVTGLPSSAAYGQTGIVATTTGGSGSGTISYSAGSSTACIIDAASGALTITSGTGSCSVTATKSADGSYEAVTSMPVSIAIGIASQSITVTQHMPTSGIYLNSTFTVSATSSSTLPVSIETSGACSGSGTNVATITITSDSGTCAVAFSQPGNSNYAPATQVTENANSQMEGQSITVTEHAPTFATYGTTFTVNASATSGLPVAYSASGSCTNTGSTFSVTSGIGNCTIMYSQSGDATFSAATQVVETTTAQKAEATITLSNLKQVYDGTNKAVTVTTTPDGITGLNVTYDGSATAPIEVGSYTVVASLTNANYQVSDATGNLIIDNLPVAESEYYSVLQNRILSVNTPGVLANVTDVDPGQSLSASLVSTSANGDLVFHADGSFVYTPHTDFTGSDSFTYTVSDSQMSSTTTTATITVLLPSADLVAANQAYSITDAPGDMVTLTIAAPGLLTNSTSINNDPLTAMKVSDPIHGVVTVNTDGSFTYVSAAGFNGTDSFAYKVYDATTNTYSNQAMVLITVLPASPTLSASNDSYTVDQDTPLTVTAAAGVLANDTGAVSASLVSGPMFGSIAFNQDGSFTYTPDAGFHGVDTFMYQASNATSASNIAMGSIRVLQVTTNTLTSSANPSSFGQSVTYTSTISPALATGTVQFKSDGINLGSPVSVSSGVATLTDSSLASGSHTITAVYSGDSYYESNTGTATQNVNEDATTLTVTSSANPSAFGQSVTLTVTASPASATGIVTIKDGSATIGTANFNNGQATYVVSNFTIGSHDITAVYGGDSNSAGSTSAVMTQTVVAVTTTTTLTSTANPSVYGQSLVFTATISPSDATGDVIFKDGSTTLNTVTISNGVATLNTGLAVGDHPITATYSGSSSYAASTSSVLNQSINKADQSIAVTTSAPASATYGTSFGVSATATSGLSVTISTSGSCSGSGTGSATITVTGVGPCAVSYGQSGDASYNAATSINESVSALVATQTVTVTTSAPASAMYGTSFSVSAASTSGLPVTISTSGPCSGSGSNTASISVTGVGNCTVFYNQGGNSSFGPAPTVTNVTVTQPASQSITISQHAPSSVLANGSFTVSAASSASLSVSISASGDCSGSGTGTAVITAGSTSGTCTVTYSQSGNGNYAPATQLTDSTTVTACAFSINPTASATLNANGDSGNIAVTTSTGCAWNVSNVPSWMTLTSGASGSGNGTVTYTVAANSGSLRSATLSVAGQAYTATQAANNPGNCTYTLTPGTSPLLSGAGATGTFTLTTQTGCPWNITAVPTWITVTSGNSGTGNATISYTASTNTTNNTRLNVLTVAGQTSYVQQAGNPATCTYTLSPSGNQSISSAIGTFTVNVSTQQNCNWSTSGNNIVWMKIASSSLGTNGQGYVTFSITANTGSARTSNLTIAGQAMAVTQRAKGL